MTAIREKVLQIVATMTGLPASTLTDQVTLKDLGLGPEDIVQLIIALENEFETLLNDVEDDEAASHDDG